MEEKKSSQNEYQFKF